MTGFPHLRKIQRFIQEPFGYDNPTWQGADPWAAFGSVAPHVRPDARVPVLRHVLPAAWRPVRAYLRAGDRALFYLWWWTCPLVWKVTDALGLDPVVAQWERERRDNMTKKLSAPHHDGHGCRLDTYT